METYNSIEVTKQLVKDGKIDQEIAETIFPQLKESEDERIWKQLLNWFKDCHWDSIDDGALKRDDIIAWFEKQGYYINFRNKIQIGDEVTRNPDGVLVNLSQFKRKAKQGSQNLANSAKTCKDGQNPAWSEEDERIKRDIENLIHFALRNGSAVSPGADTTKEDALDWLKSLKERHAWKPSDEQMKDSFVFDWYLRLGFKYYGHKPDENGFVPMYYTL